MSKYTVSGSGVIAAPAEAVYGVLIDYRVGHPAILPGQYTLEVESGGRGAGTVFRLHANMMGIRRTLRMAATEPEPGRLLMETDLDGGPVTTFAVEPLPGGQSRLTITTVTPQRAGIVGRLERRATESLLRRMYAHEFRALGEYLSARPASSVPA